jgi:peptidoglycan/LPS O-acetylase OafA/YrhL
MPRINMIACGVLLFIGCAFTAPALSPLAVLAIPLLISVAISAPALSKLFGCQALLWLGKVSYSLYMTHALIEMFFVNPLLRWSARYFAFDLTQSRPASAILLFCAIGLALLAGWLTWRWIEVPGRSMINRYMNDAVVPVAQAAIPP